MPLFIVLKRKKKKRKKRKERKKNTDTFIFLIKILHRDFYMSEPLDKREQ